MGAYVLRSLTPGFKGLGCYVTESCLPLCYLCHLNSCFFSGGCRDKADHRDRKAIR